MGNDALPCEAALPTKLMAEIRDNLLVGTRMGLTLWRKQLAFAQHDEKPVQRGSIAEKGVAITLSKGPVAVYDPLVDVPKTHAVTGEPPAEVVGRPNFTLSTLLAVPLGQQPRGWTIKRWLHKKHPDTRMNDLVAQHGWHKPQKGGAGMPRKIAQRPRLAGFAIARICVCCCVCVSLLAHLDR